MYTTTTTKTIKSAAKEAKKRLKSRFWEDYKKQVESGVLRAKSEGFTASGVKSYFRRKIERTIKGVAVEEEKFYNAVKTMVDESGKPSDALDRLMDKRLFAKLAYEEKERYLFRLADRYLKALERYDRERQFEQRLSVD